MSRKTLGGIATILVGVLTYFTLKMEVGLMRSTVQYASAILAIQFIAIAWSRKRV